MSRPWILALYVMLQHISSIGCTQLMNNDFENGYLGHMYNDADDHYDWVIHQGPTDTHDTGPNTDHTKGTAEGRYIYVDSSKANAGETGKLSTNFGIYPNLTGPYQLSFWYHMNGTGVGILTVEVELRSGEIQVLWNSTGTAGAHWFMGAVHVPNRTQILSFVTIRADRADSRGDVALDDISIWTTETDSDITYTNCTCTVDNNDSSVAWALFAVFVVLFIISAIANIWLCCRMGQSKSDTPYEEVTRPSEATGAISPYPAEFTVESRSGAHNIDHVDATSAGYDQNADDMHLNFTSLGITDDKTRDNSII